ncbi:endonuclease/exonuclease/phosphatase family protein [Paeniroseomonas aquatica]|uniref:Endonuclease/exonuclease/phosphatase family protein n=1 Tax=Paeniroseomonas aquatica TaxID=373043 RepID=A0ABT8A1C5_9PROT|nr:endonuclease/exonuclease/phosphatase family protein [Paeniroseomonas aquatica]MDN3563416.1 endonuclease/exonuclease/phosphatase family protein [Paeniroseomonas aquatica]
MLVATYNVHRGRGPFGRFRPSRIAAVLAEIRPDLIALQEAQHYLRPGRDMLDFQAIRRELGLIPLRVPDCPGHSGWRSNVVLVRDGAGVGFGPLGLRLGGLEPRGGIVAELDLGEGPFRLLACHLSLGAARRAVQAERLVRAVQSGRGPDLPTLLLGDLNEWRQDRSALAVLRPVFGPSASPPGFPSFRPMLSLDHILTRPSGMLRSLAVHDTPLARRASDHLPLTAQFDLAGRAVPEAPARGP